MGNRYELIVFDWDGTLLDSTWAIAGSIQAACHDLGYAVPSDERARHVIGLGLHEALLYVVPELKDRDVPRLIERYRLHYLAGDHALKPFDGIPELLAHLADSGFRMAVATGKSRVGLTRAMQYSGFSPFFTATRCADECFSKPHPQMLFDLMKQLNVPADKMVMIGDTTHDLKMAANASVDGVAVAYGAHATEMLVAENPVACLHSVGYLREWLKLHA